MDNKENEACKKDVKLPTFFFVSNTVLRPDLIYYVDETFDKKRNGYRVAYEDEVFIVTQNELYGIKEELCGDKSKGWIEVGGVIINVNRIYYIAKNADDDSYKMYYTNEVFDLSFDEVSAIMNFANCLSLGISNG